MSESKPPYIVVPRENEFDKQIKAIEKYLDEVHRALRDIRQNKVFPEQIMNQLDQQFSAMKDALKTTG